MNVPYAVLPVSLAILYFYLFSFLLLKTGFISRSFHCKIWNYILLIIFLPLIFTGIFLALQINYRWDIPFLEKILNWHVNTGIAFSITAIIHLIRHLKYYLFSASDIKKKDSSEPLKHSYQHSMIKLFLLGFVSLTSQIVIIRTGLNIFEGNELTIGMVLGLWMLFTALGAFAGKRELPQKIDAQISVNGILILSLFTLVVFLLIIIIKYIFYPPGVGAGLGGTLLIFAVVLLPFCFLSGVIFLRISKEVKAIKESGFTFSYFLFSIFSTNAK